MRVAILFVILGVATAQTKSAYISGDPHFTTFDGCNHDFQFEGLATAYKSADGLTEVQMQAIRCNSNTAKPVSCTRTFTIKVSGTIGRGDTPYIIIQWGLFGAWPAAAAKNDSVYGFFPARAAVPAVVDNVLIKGETLTSAKCPNNNAKVDSVCDPEFFTTAYTFPNVGYSLQYDKVNKRLRLWQSSVTNGASFTISQYSLTVTLPSSLSDTNPFIYGSGLLGYFNGNAAQEFYNRNGTNHIPGSTAGSNRYNTAAVYEWGRSWLITDPANALLNVHRHSTQHYMVEALPEAKVPDASVQARINQPNFDNQAQVTQAQAFCQALYADSPKSDALTVQIENCVFDLGLLSTVQGDDFPDGTKMAASNLQALAIADSNTQSSSSSSLSGGAIAAIVIGCALFVALVAVAVLHARLKSTRRDLSRALVLSTANGQSNQELNVGEQI